MLKKLFLSALLALPLVVVQLAAGEASSTASATPRPITFNFTDSSGKKIRIVETPEGLKLPDFKGKKVILLFYIYSGTPCRNELQLFTRLKPKFPDLEFVTFELKGLSPEKLKAFEKELKLEGLHMIDSAQAVPFARYIAQRARWQGSVPLIIAIDPRGAVKHMQLGAMNAEELEKLYRSL